MLVRMADLVGLHHAALSVTDLDRSVRWYQDVLGMDVAFMEDGDTRRAAVLRLPGTGSVLAIVQHRGSDQTAFSPQRVGLDHLAFTVADRDDLDAWAARLSAHDVACDAPVDVPPGAILNFKDPDGIALALFWDRGS